MLEQKQFSKATSELHLQLTKFDVKEGIIEAVVSSYGNLDKENDRILPGAFDDAIGTYKNQELPMLFQHQQNEIIGEWTSVSQKGDLIIATGEIYPEVSKGRDAMALISRGMISSTSIGFLGAGDRNEEGGYDIKTVKLQEISLVRNPANPKAEIISAKNKDGSIDIKRLESVLREAGLSRMESKRLLNDGAKGLREAVISKLQSEERIAKLKRLLET